MGLRERLGFPEREAEYVDLPLLDATPKRPSRGFSRLFARRSDAKVVSIATDGTITESGGGQPLDSDLTAIAALTTTSFGRALLELANAAALRTAGGLVIGTDVDAFASTVSQAEAEAGAATTVRNWTAQRVAQAISALGGAGGSVATDAIWDEAGDEAVGTGANTAVRRKNNDAATVAPTVNDDAGDGYAIGSRWRDTTADLEYVCLDATTTAAVWRLTTGLKYVSIDGSQIAAVTDASTTAVSVAQTSVAELTGIPIGAKFVDVRVLVTTSAINATNRLNLHDYGVATGGRTAWCPGVATYFTEFEVAMLKLGGTNNRQFDYSIVRGAGTITYYIRVMGYWIASA